VVVEGQTFNAISNVGVNPTVETGTKIKVETHIIDYENYIYNEIVQVQFYDFIRPERTFDSLEELKQQIEADIETCRRIVGNK
jgi:riboflavin kinase/FMN adenylyltransferase